MGCMQRPRNVLQESAFISWLSHWPRQDQNEQKKVIAVPKWAESTMVATVIGVHQFL